MLEITLQLNFRFSCLGRELRQKIGGTSVQMEREMTKISRRTAIGIVASVPIARPTIARAQASSAPIKIGLISDVSGPYRENGGPGTKYAVEMAVTDFGGTLLGRPLQVLQADGQNKPDTAAAIARSWIDIQGVDVLADGASSAAALAIQQIARDKKRIYLMNTSIATALVGKQCSPYGFQFAGNAYALTKGVTDTLTRQGDNSWFIITIDNESGYALQANMEDFVKGAGGRVMGAVRTPLGASDYSSYLIQGTSSGAKVIGLGLSGADLQNCIKQAAEFGLVESGHRLATPTLLETDVVALGQDVCKGLLLSAAFYWNMSPETRAWGERFIARMGKPPVQYHAAAYAAVTHWMKAVRDLGTLDADAVAEKMRQTPVNDFYIRDVHIQASGTVPLTMYLFEVKPLSKAKERWDMYDLRGSLPSPEAFPPPGLFGCPLVPS